MAMLFFLCKSLFAWPFVCDVVRLLIPRIWVTLRGSAWLQVLTEAGGTMERWRRRVGRQDRGESERCSGPAGGSPQATSDIPLSDGLMRLP